MGKRILIIDDDKELCSLLSELLRADGFEVEAHHRGSGASERAVGGQYSLVILDVMLPEINGFAILKEIRRSSNIPVILLTARGEEVDRVIGLEIGADDYLPKPFSARELMARIQAVLRRFQGAGATPKVFAVGDVVLDTGARSVEKAGEHVELTTIEFDLLHALLASAGEVVTREELAKTVLGRQFDPFDRSIDMHVSRIRRKLGDDSNEAELVKTVRGVGYIYAAPSTRRFVHAKPRNQDLSQLLADSRHYLRAHRDHSDSGTQVLGGTRSPEDWARSSLSLRTIRPPKLRAVPDCREPAKPRAERALRYIRSPTLPRNSLTGIGPIHPRPH